MSLNARAIAVSGIGFGALLTAVVGLHDAQTDAVWDTSQGVARNAFIKFTPIQDIEATYTGVVAKTSVGHVYPYSDALAIVSVDECYTGYARIFNIKANGYAPIVLNTNWTRAGEVTPIADCNTEVVGHVLNTSASIVSPGGDAAAIYEPQERTTDTSMVYPTGIQNPTDEELIVMIQAIRRSRHEQTII